MNTEQLKNDWQTQRHIIIENYRSKPNPLIFFNQISKLLDNVLMALWQKYFADSQMSLMAIGGYGRGEVYPYSDLDFAIVLSEAPSTTTEETIAQLIGELWDMGLQPAPKIGTIKELCDAVKEDLTGDTALLEARHICGQSTLSETLQQELTAQRQVAKFIEGKIAEQEQRHAKDRGSGSQLEPNIKTCPGGLRDIHTMLWLAKAQGLSIDFTELVGNQVLTEIEARLLRISHRYLARIRIALHLCAKRGEERLLFDYQIQVAEFMGLSDDNLSQKK